MKRKQLKPILEIEYEGDRRVAVRLGGVDLTNHIGGNEIMLRAEVDTQAGVTLHLTDIGVVFTNRSKARRR